MTRKGLALGATASLLSAAFVGLPANAAGIDNGSVSLLPTSGAEYDTIAGSKFKLSANFAQGILGAGKYLKLYVADPLQKITAVTGQYAPESIAGNDLTVADADGGAGDDDVITVEITGHKFKVGDVVIISNTAGGNANDLPAGAIGEQTITAVTANTIDYEVGEAVIAAAAAADYDVTVAMATITERDASFGFVVDFKQDTNNADATALFTSTDANVTQSIDVTAWVDTNDNGEIDATEYVSKTRTVRFLASTAITPTVTWDPIAVGASTVVGNVTFSPTLNGSQLSSADNLNGAANAVQLILTRPGSAEAELAATVAYSNVTKKWTATSINMNAAAWNITDAAAQIAANTNKVAIEDDVVTLTTTVDHNLEVGDTVIVANSNNADVNNPAAVVLSVPSAKVFTYSVTTANAGATDAAEAVDANVTMAVAGGASKILRDYVVTGQYTGQVQLYRFNAGAGDALANLGTKFATTVGATTASSATTAPTFTGVASATVSAAGKVKTGTTSANYVLSVYDKLGDAVGAGVTAKITTTTVTSAGTVTVNGATVISGSSFVADTDANGQIAIAVTNSSGAAAESIVMDAVVQGVNATQFTTTWEDAVYSIYDSADVNKDSSARNRAVAAGGTYTFNLTVMDQWMNPADSSIYRLVSTATQNGAVVATNVVSLTNGKATLAVADAGLDADTTVSLAFQKQTLGVWAALDDATVNDWAGAAGNDLAVVTLKYYDQTDAFTFNADAATLPSGTKADLTADVTTVALTSVDQRFTTGVPGTYPAATKAVFGGKITNSNTGVAKSGAAITVAASGVLFKVGDVWATDSLTFISNDGTFSVEAYSQVASAAKTVTVSHESLSKTVSLVFKAVASTKGYSVDLTVPASVPAGSTYRVDGQILDVNGNGVAVTTAGTGANPTLTVTYLGLGLVSGSLPTTTDKHGKFYFYVLVGSNDKGTATITATYDADGTGTTSAAATVSETVYVGQSAPTEAKVNAGSFKGYVAIYAKGHEGKRLSAKVGKDWVVVPALASNFERVVEYTGAGYTIAVRIYIDRVLVDTITVTTK